MATTAEEAQTLTTEQFELGTSDGCDEPYVFAKADAKCPLDDKERLFRTKNYEPLSLEECYNLCKDTKGCRYFTHGNTNGHDSWGSSQGLRGLCMGCTEAAESEKHEGFTHFFMNPKCKENINIYVGSALPSMLPSILYDADSPSVSPSEILIPAVKGDPHFMTWSGEKYDFHGVCDLVLVHVAGFGEGIGMDIHIRSERMNLWSFVASAVVRIGHEIFEVIGGGKAKFLINGVEGKSKSNEDGISLASTISGFPIHRICESGKGDKFAINLGNNEKIVISTWHSFVSVSFENARSDTFKGSVGLLGSFSGGLKLARDGTTIITGLTEYGQEWQVRDSEPQLFHTIEGPQHPSKCEIPSSTEMRRRLGESGLTMNEAKQACVNVNEDEMNLCIFDVLASNNKFTAGAY